MIDIIKNNKALLGIIIAGIVLSILPFTGISLYLVTFLFIVLFNSALTVSWNILGGYSGYVSFGHVAFVGAGGYTTALLLQQMGWSPLLTTPLAGILAALLAFVIGYPCLRLRGPYFSLITLIIALAVKVVVINLPGLNIAAGLFITAPADNIQTSRLILYQSMLVILIFTVIVAYLVENSRFGIGLKAIREDEEVASTQGINTTTLKLSAFVLSAGLAGLAGGIYSWYQGFLFPDPMFSINLTVLVVLMALVGGTDSWVGAISGAVLISIIRELLNLSIGSTVSQIVFGILLVVTILFLPHGLLGWVKLKARSRAVKKAAIGGAQ
jgi:branched-chain amino acid transport system permease protein